MDARSLRSSEAARSCGIAGRLGYAVVCPEGGCALLRALGDELPTDRRAVCPLEERAHGDNETVLRTLDELRREMQRHPAAFLALRAEATRARRHTDALRRWA
jgi:hypothetical protein